MLRSLFLLCFFLGVSGEIVAQFTQPARFEREHKNNDTDFIIIPMGEKGLALVQDKNKFTEGNQQWEVTVLDSALRQQWVLSLDLEPRLRIVGYEFRDDMIYLLYRSGEHEGSPLELFTIHSESQETQRYHLKLDITFKVTHFSALANSIVLGGYVAQDPAILIYDCVLQSSKIVPGFFVSDAQLLDLRVNSNHTFNAVLLEQKNKEQKLILKTFDATGALLLDDIIKIDKKHTILTSVSSALLNDELMLLGTWTEGVARQASGIYSVLIDPFSEQTINYYDFGQFEHFLDYQSAKRAANVREKSQQANARNEIPSFKTYVNPLKLEEGPGGFALLAEVYTPTSTPGPYASAWNTYPGSFPGYGYSPYNSPFMNRYYRQGYQQPYGFAPTPADGNVLHSSIAVFDMKGKLKEDYGLKLETRDANSSDQASDFLYYNGKVTIAYKTEKDIRITMGADGDVKSDTLYIQLKNPDETLRGGGDRRENSFIRSWYKNYFYAWGYHNVKSSSKDAEDPNRHVFYINKIRVDQ